MENPSLGKHIFSQFDDDLSSIRTDVLKMGGVVEEQINKALKAVQDTDSELGGQVVTDDYKVNDLEVRIDEKCTQILALHQPTASDLRTVVAIIKTITDLERIGDEAEKIGRMAQRLSGKIGSTRRYKGVANLGHHVWRMVHDTLDAFARLDVDAALDLAKKDEQIDLEYAACMRELVTYMMEDPRQISEIMDFIWCARALERIGDHAKNICEYIIFLVKGKDVRHTSIEHMTLQAHSET